MVAKENKIYILSLSSGGYVQSSRASECTALGPDDKHVKN